ncbi:helix-turn-helix transcriptional regulator [Nocardioides euryhalodurans]|uniref:Helix-turn-helix transcriptional regulator n=1 Tax=Nocardioides euryhalodurans TaxID=2518370 RepID=A0A4P7GML1_9ACTN|nr:helix-turn-helix transcriptional regulator [Nocardioides euryhalodurans]QBR93376.1 helix-turn-helix transcriptional regulator [Nocardioides euryhalodurans]
MLVGRETERRALEQLLAGARVGDSRVLVLSGEPGIGKTALLGEVLPLAEGMRVLRAEGVESERLVPFAGLSQLLHPLLPLLDLLPTPQASALAAALLLAPPGPDGPPTRFAVGAATLSLLSRAAEERPLVVVVDDGHLVDEASAEALAFAARRLLTDPVALVVAVREGEPGADTWAALPTLTLTGLDLPSAADLLAATVPGQPSTWLSRLHRATGGNPLALLELGDRADLLDPAPADSPVAVPEAVSRAFIGQVAGLGEEARTALLVAATDGASAATVLDACRVLGVDGPALAEAVDAGLVAVRGDRVEFRHPLVRSAVYGAAPPATRRTVHRALAQVVAPGETDRLAWHLSESAVAPDEEVARTLDDVARRAAVRGAHAIAATAHERAAALTASRSQRAERLVEAAAASWLAGRMDLALALVERALVCEPDAVLRARALELRGAVLTRSGSLSDAHATLLEAAATVESADPGLAVRIHADAVHVCFYLADAEAGMRSCAVVERLLPGVVDPDTRAIGLMATGMALVHAGRGPAGVERVREALRSLVDTQPPTAELFRHPVRVHGALWLRERGSTRDEVNEVVARMRDRAAFGSLPLLLMQLGRDAATTDRWEDAEAAYAEAIRLAGETGQTTDLAMSLGGLAVLLGRQGRGPECAAAADEAEQVAGVRDIRIALVWAWQGRGDLAVGAGDPAAAVVHYERVEELLAGLGFADPDQSCAPELVEAYVHSGRVEDARRVAEAFARRAAAKDQAWSLARAARARALCAEGPAAEECFRTALALHAATPDAYETARTQLAYGAWLRRERRRVEARPVLRAALDAFEHLGAGPWAERAAQEVEATGEVARRRDADPADHLTPQERQVAQLLAAGRTTREAAAALFLSPKTVEYHLRNVYLKLDIRSRAELADRLGGR